MSYNYQSLAPLKILPVNKTVAMRTSFEGNDTLVRTGTIGTGSCFYHAFLHGYMREYSSMTREERSRTVRKLRASLAGKVDKEKWEELGGGVIAKIPFQKNVNFILTNIYRFLTNDSKSRGSSTKKVLEKLMGEGEDLEKYQIVTELVPIEDLEQKILLTAYSKTEDDYIAETKTIIVQDILDMLNKKDEIQSLPEDKADYIRKIAKKFFKTILDRSERDAFKSFIKGLQNMSEEVDEFTIGIISDHFNRDIYFVDGRTRIPYSKASPQTYLKRRKSIILAWVGENHYEIVGVCLPGNHIQREFLPDHPLVDRLYTFLCHPDQNPPFPRSSDRNSEHSEHHSSSDNESEEENSDYKYYSLSDNDRSEDDN